MLEPDTDETEALMKKLILQSGVQDGIGADSDKKVSWTTVLPKPGFCLKTKKENGEKVFINVCQAENVPQPKEITEEELLKLLESEDPFGFRVPMSIGEPHAEIDKSGQGCTAYDVVIHPGFMEKMKDSEIFKTFFLSVTLEGLEEKYSIALSRDWVILKNRKSVGRLQEQNVRTQSKPVIMEMGDQSMSGLGKPLIQEMDTPKPLSQEELRARGQKPEFRIIQEPPEGHPDFLVAEISLPHVKMANTLTIDVGEDRLVLETRSNKYYLDIYLPYLLIQEDCVAQFNRKTRILTLTLPVQPEN
ncbi:PIH1 domain-containing protein 1-like [Saccostrea echinata]|uniref:PIH1 domain-containing protein 1-like n=1 Tax=Saccostrea echinata TaxID=191078 RepID=UPI002A816967|nr:PIH1 domain-containing protein 1-like [Saccostrea echinata]